MATNQPGKIFPTRHQKTKRYSLFVALISPTDKILASEVTEHFKGDEMSSQDCFTKLKTAQNKEKENNIIKMQIPCQHSLPDYEVSPPQPNHQVVCMVSCMRCFQQAQLPCGSDLVPPHQASTSVLASASFKSKNLERLANIKLTQ